MKTTFITLIILYSFFFCANSFGQQKGETIKHAQKNLAQKQENKAKLQKKIDKEKRKHFLSIQTKETQKRLKKLAKADKKRLKAQKHKRYIKR